MSSKEVRCYNQYIFFNVHIRIITNIRLFSLHCTYVNKGGHNVYFVYFLTFLIVIVVRVNKNTFHG